MIAATNHLLRVRVLQACRCPDLAIEMQEATKRMRKTKRLVSVDPNHLGRANARPVASKFGSNSDLTHTPSGAFAQNSQNAPMSQNSFSLDGEQVLVTKTVALDNTLINKVFGEISCTVARIQADRIKSDPAFESLVGPA